MTPTIEQSVTFESTPADRPVDLKFVTRLPNWKILRFSGINRMSIKKC